MPSKIGDAIAVGGLITLIVSGYYLVLSNHSFLNSLNEANRPVYALVSTSVMVLLGVLMGVTWDLLDKSVGDLKGKRQPVSH